MKSYPVIQMILHTMIYGECHINFFNEDSYFSFIFCLFLSFCDFKIISPYFPFYSFILSNVAFFRLSFVCLSFETLKSPLSLADVELGEGSDLMNRPGFQALGNFK